MNHLVVSLALVALMNWISLHLQVLAIFLVKRAVTFGYVRVKFTAKLDLSIFPSNVVE